ncbi:MAG: hypothetical protein LUH05_05200 [Candidatus Gastranaerophilales bacterium]|nr:hypothetical protein [Candidatus Gastranaerophilales bacterium]
MNPRLVKFAVELQTGENTKEEKCIYFNKGRSNKFFDFLKSAKVTIPIDKNN